MGTTLKRITVIKPVVCVPGRHICISLDMESTFTGREWLSEIHLIQNGSQRKLFSCNISINLTCMKPEANKTDYIFFTTLHLVCHFLPVSSQICKGVYQRNIEVKRHTKANTVKSVTSFKHRQSVTNFSHLLWPVGTQWATTEYNVCWSLTSIQRRYLSDFCAIYLVVCNCHYAVI